MYKVRKDLTGLTLNNWTVLEYSQTKDNKLAFWKCKCICGKTKEVRACHLISGNSFGCGCNNIPTVQKGFKINDIEVLELDNSNKKECKKSNRKWICKCECGSLRFISERSIREGLDKTKCSFKNEDTKGFRMHCHSQEQKNEHFYNLFYKYCEIRKQRKKDAKGSFTQEEFQKLCDKYNNKCLKCGCKPENENLCADHVVALSRGGTNYISNMQPLCRSCNSNKGFKHIDYRNNSKIKFKYTDNKKQNWNVYPPSYKNGNWIAKYKKIEISEKTCENLILKINLL